MQGSHFGSQFARDGYALVPAVLGGDECAQLAQKLQAQGQPGSRTLLLAPWCAELIQRLRGQPALAALLPADAVAVQCTYFEKSRDTNWLVPLHQDLSIPVRARIESPALTGWSQKQGALFVQPPASVLQQLVAVRLHIDDCGPQDGPLRVVPGSHQLGITDAAQALAVRDAGVQVSCTAERGAALVMRPLLLHASSKATGHSVRRVLHFVFGPPALPLGLQWAHAVP